MGSEIDINATLDQLGYGVQDGSEVRYLYGVHPQEYSALEREVDADRGYYQTHRV